MQVEQVPTLPVTIRANILLEEFTEFQLLNDSDILQDVWDKATVAKDDESRYYQMDVLWYHISLIKKPDSALKLPRLSKIGILVLTVPHSNAEEEHFFPLSQKNCISPLSGPKGNFVQHLNN